MQDIKSLSYSLNPLEYQVLINDVDYTEDVADMSPIQSSLDYPNLNTYRNGEVTLTINDVTGVFSPEGVTNWVGIDVEIKAGYQGVLKDLFKGKILKVTQTSVQGVVDIEVTDVIHDLFTKPITDFGVDKHFGLVEGDQRDINGFYPVPDAFFPASDGSVRVAKSTSEDLTEVDEVSRQGPLDPDNFELTSEGIVTEGGPVRNPQTGYPQIQYKAPYRYRDVDVILSDLLQLVETTGEIEIPDVDIPEQFASSGRVGYDVIGTSIFGSSNPIDWQGYVTDQIFDGGKYYYLYNPVRGDRGNTAFILEKDKATNVSRVVYRESQVTTHTTEYWKIAKNANLIAVLATDADKTIAGDGALPDISVPTAGSYDATQGDSGSYIFILDISDNSRNLRVPKSSGIKPQIGHYYIFGETFSDFRSDSVLAAQIPQSPPFVLPDTRKSFKWSGSHVYFVCVSSTTVGVARVGLTSPPEQLIGIPFDGSSGKFGVDFDIIGNTLMVAFTYKEGARSRVSAFRTTIT